MKDYLKNETISRCCNQYQIQVSIPAYKMRSEFFSKNLSLSFNFTQKSTNNAKNEYSQISHGIVLQKTGLTSFNPAQTCECQKREREYKLMLKIQQGRRKQTWSWVTQMVMAKIQDRKKKYNLHKGTEQSSPLVLLKSVETWHGRNKMFSVC